MRGQGHGEDPIGGSKVALDRCASSRFRVVVAVRLRCNGMEREEGERRPAVQSYRCYSSNWVEHHVCAALPTLQKRLAADIYYQYLQYLNSKARLPSFSCYCTAEAAEPGNGSGSNRVPLKVPYPTRLRMLEHGQLLHMDYAAKSSCDEHPQQAGQSRHRILDMQVYLLPLLFRPSAPVLAVQQAKASKCARLEQRSSSARIRSLLSCPKMPCMASCMMQSSDPRQGSRMRKHPIGAAGLALGPS